MADDRFDSRPTPFRESHPWTDLFRTFRVALELKKLLLAAAGILAMSCGGWLIRSFSQYLVVNAARLRERALQAPSPCRG